MLHIEVLGLQAQDAPTLVFSSGLGGLGIFWAPQLDALISDYRVVVYDHAGTGLSPAELQEDYDIGDMAEELRLALQRLNIGTCHFIGHALGGLIGLELAKRSPQTVQSLILINAWAQPNPHTARCFAVRKKLLTQIGPAAYVEAQALFLFPPAWIAANEQRLEKEDAHALRVFPDPENLLKRINALLRFNANDYLHRIQIPVLLIANRDDSLVPWTCSELLAAGLPQAKLVIMEQGGHASSITHAKTISDMLESRLKIVTQSPKTLQIER